MNLNFDLSKNIPWGPPYLNFQNFEAAFLGSKAAQDNETLHAESIGRGCQSAIGFERLHHKKNFLTMLYGMFFGSKVTCVK